jgi:uncharacterized protein involved in exopolysaccharide biosynthesis
VTNPHKGQRAVKSQAREPDLFPFANAWNWVGFVLRSVPRHKVLAASCFLAMVGLTVVALAVIPYRYQVQASLLAQRNPLMVSLSNPGLNRDWDLPTRAAREVVLRRDNLVALCTQTRFVERHVRGRGPAARAFHWLLEKLGVPPPTQEELLEGVVDTLERRLSVWANNAEGTVTITFEWSNRELAYDLVAAAVQSFIEARHVSEINAVGETVAILEGHDARIRQEIAVTTRDLEEKERTLRARVAPRRYVPPPVAPAHDEELARLEAQLATRRRALADLEDYRQRRLAELQSQLAQQLTIYAPQHPAVLSTRQSLEGLNQSSPQLEALRAEVSTMEGQVVLRGGSPDVQGQGQLQLMQSELAEARLRLADEDPRLEYERSQLRLLLRQHSNLLERIDAARVEMDTAQAAFKGRYIVTTPPQLPKRPSWPNPLAVLAGGLLGGVCFALFACATVDIRSGKVIEAWQIESELDLDVIANLRR